MRNTLRWIMIKSFRHKGLRILFDTGRVSGIQPSHAKRLRMQLAVLDTARSVIDVDMPGFALHRLKVSMSGRWAISVSGNWRVTFEFREGDAYVLDYEDFTNGHAQSASSRQVHL